MVTTGANQGCRALASIMWQCFSTNVVSELCIYILTQIGTQEGSLTTYNFGDLHFIANFPNFKSTKIGVSHLNKGDIACMALTLLIFNDI